MRVLDQDTVHGHLAALVGEGFALCGFCAGVAAARDEAFVAFEPADFEDVKFSSCRADVGYGVWDGAVLDLRLNCGHTGIYVAGTVLC